jgi:hypothetical protein
MLTDGLLGRAPRRAVAHRGRGRWSGCAATGGGSFDLRGQVVAANSDHRGGELGESAVPGSEAVAEDA